MFSYENKLLRGTGILDIEKDGKIQLCSDYALSSANDNFPILQSVPGKSMLFAPKWAICHHGGTLIFVHARNLPSFFSCLYFTFNALFL